MKKIILCLFLLSVIFLVSAQTDFNKYYELDLNYDRGEIELIKEDIYFSDKEMNNNFGFYSLVLRDFENNSLEIIFFEVPNKILYDEVDENGTIISGGEAELENVNFTIYVPYYENASVIKIYDEALDEKLIFDVSEYSDGIALEKQFENVEENINKSSQDSNISDEISSNGSDENLFDKLSRNWWILLVILLALVFILVKSLTKEGVKKK